MDGTIKLKEGYGNHSKLYDVVFLLPLRSSQDSVLNRTERRGSKRILRKDRICTDALNCAMIWPWEENEARIETEKTSSQVMLSKNPGVTTLSTGNPLN